MKRLFKFFFPKEVVKEEILFDSIFLYGKFTKRQLDNLNELFPTIPNKLIIGNRNHLSNAWIIVKYYSDLVQIRKETSTQFILKYPRSTIITSLQFIQYDITINEMLNFDIYNLKREKHNLEPLIRGFHFFTIMIQVVYVDIEEYILTLSSSRKEEELDETMLQLKKIISNE